MAALAGAVRQLGQWRRLDSVAQRVEAVARRPLNPTPVKNALSGVWLGHRLHPLLTDVAIGAFSAATLVDLAAPRSKTAARRLVGIGLVAAAPTATAGLNDWIDVYEDGRRIGLVHAAGNIVALGCFFKSFRRRALGHGRAWGLLGLGAMGASGYLGGHLSYVLGVGVDHTAFQPRLEDWTDVAASADVGEARLVRVDAGPFPVLLARISGRLHALGDRCSHAGWGLADGELADGCVTCPAHGSVFSVLDGSVRRGPAASPQVTYEVREAQGRIEVRSYDA